MPKYKPKNEKKDTINQLLALGIKVNALNDEIISVECKALELQQVKNITGLDFEEV